MYNAERLFEIARYGILSHWIPISEPSYIRELSEEGASFVTLTIDGSLRGCIGSTVAHRPLGVDIFSNSRAAAFSDPRFNSLTRDEYDKIRVEVSILTPPEKVQFSDKEELRTIITHNDGVILQTTRGSATFLPQVWEKLSDFDLFFTHLSLKAGIGPNPFIYEPTILRYQVQPFLEQL